MVNYFIYRALFEYGLTQVWLVGQLKEKGIKTDKTELSSVLCGRRHGPKADSIIKASKEILSKYGRGVKNAKTQNV